MKNIARIIACLFLFFSITPTIVFGMDNGGTNPLINLNDTILNETEQATFFEQVANDDEIINLVNTAALKRGREISTNGTHACTCIKLYGLKNSEYPLQSLCNIYGETGKIQSEISEDYALLILYVNENDEFVDTFMFMKKDNDPEAYAINGWIPIGSGSLMGIDESLVYYPEGGTLINIIKDLGLNDTEELKFISYIPEFPQSIFFVKNGEEFLIPFYDSYAGIQAYSVYKVSDIVETYLNPILEFQIKQMETAERDENGYYLNYGASSVPDELPLQKAIDLNSYFSKSVVVDNATNEQQGEMGILLTGNDMLKSGVSPKNKAWIWGTSGATIAVIIIIVLILKNKKA